MHSFLGPSIGSQSTSGHGLFSSGISCPYPADQGGFLLASGTLFLVSQSLVFEHSLCQMTFSPCKCVVIILTACLQIWVFLSNICVICVCDISRQSFSCGHFQTLWPGLKNLHALYLSLIWSSAFCVLEWYESCFRPLCQCQGTFCVSALNLPPGVAQSIVASSSPASGVGRALPESGGEPEKLAEERVTCSHFRRRRVVGKPACRASGKCRMVFSVYPFLRGHFGAVFKRQTF